MQRQIFSHAIYQSYLLKIYKRNEYTKDGFLIFVILQYPIKSRIRKERKKERE